MTYQLEDFAQEYAARTDEDLLRLAIARQDLNLEARIALDGEMTRRGLSNERVSAFEHELAGREKAWALERANRLFGIYPHGFGPRRFCKWDRRSDGAFREEFTTTVFFVFLYLPLFPVGTYRVWRNKEWGRPNVIEKLPLNWSQVLEVWAGMALVLLGLVIFFRFGTQFLK